MAIVIADIHGDIEKAKAFLSYKPQIEHIVLGDLVDGRKSGITLETELDCLDLLFQSDAILLWGNHDLAYTTEQPWGCFTRYTPTQDEELFYSSQSEYLAKMYQENGNLVVREILTDRYQPHRNRMKAAYAVDNWLCTHAGVAKGIADFIPPAIIAAGASGIADWLNEEFQRELQVPVPLSGEIPRYGFGPLFQIHRSRLGTDPFGGIFWFDPFGEIENPSPLVGRQIFGHSPVPYPDIGGHWVNLNTFEKGIWVFDTQENCLIDIVSGENKTIGILA